MDKGFSLKNAGLFLAKATLTLLLLYSCASAQQATKPGNVNDYIRTSWSTLTRSVSDCRSFHDAKVKTPSILYVPKGMPTAELAEQLAHCNVEVRPLPKVIHTIGDTDPREIRTSGLLYLPHPYVVPGGMFNEMYGWDSYFIIRGLIADDSVNLARGIVENFFYEIKNYGGVLNANRTYFLTRSQPPFLTSMIRAVYESGPHDRKWLLRAYGYAKRDHALWLRPEHRAGDTGLARYYDYGNGPVPEMAQDNSYYAKVAQFTLFHQQAAAYRSPARKTDDDQTFYVRTCTAGDKAACAKPARMRLGDDYYKGDRAMRESGFDTSFRFGPYGGRTQDFAPVDLNALLYKSERDLEWMANELGLKGEAKQWAAQAAQRKQNIDKYLWNPAKGAYFDYDVVAHKQSDYLFATTFYPLWTGVASRSQATAVEHMLGKLEKPGGIVTSDNVSGAQWDAPYGWAPVQLLAVEGLNRYGFHVDALRIAKKFNSMVNENFQRDGTIREKYNVETRSDSVKVAVGYSQNNVGFGWTNGVYEVLRTLAGNHHQATKAGKLPQ